MDSITFGVRNIAGPGSFCHGYVSYNFEGKSYYSQQGSRKTKITHHHFSTRPYLALPETKGQHADYPGSKCAVGHIDIFLAMLHVFQPLMKK